jgi:hypothetical protein
MSNLIEKTDSGLSIALGLIVGAILGGLLENFGFGLAVGLSISTLVNALREKQQQTEGADVAVMIAFAGGLFVIFMWIVS